MTEYFDIYRMSLCIVFLKDRLVQFLKHGSNKTAEIRVKSYNHKYRR